jgi:3-phytase
MIQKHLTWLGLLLGLATLWACNTNGSNAPTPTAESTAVTVDTATVQAAIITDTVQYDTDDPAFWINPANPAQSLVLGTDKDENGALYVFDLNGKVLAGKTVKGLNRPNNVDVEYGLELAGKRVDIAVVTERHTHSLRVFSLPGMQPIDGGGLPMFEGDTATGFRDLMGIGLYKDASGAIYAIVGRKTGPTNGSYLGQYLLSDNGKGQVRATLVRQFGQYSGKKEIESIFVDDQLGYMYYSDEGVGVRKYHADPKKGNAELALFGTSGFIQDHEGISMYATSDTTGFLLVSDQQAQSFRIFLREGSAGNPHQHPLLKVVRVSALESDGSETTSLPLNGKFAKGLFVAMSTDKTFHFYPAEQVLGTLLK